MRQTSQTRQQRIIETREAIDNYNKELNEARQRLEKLEGRKVSLEVLQQAALGKESETIESWLAQCNLHDNKRLVDELEVEAGWEKAVETVLGDHLQAIGVDNLTSLATEAAKLSAGKAALFDIGSKAHIVKKTLATKINSSWPIAELLNHVYIAETLNEALKLRNKLKSHQSVITRDGIWLGINWLRVNKTVDDKEGVLQRGRELDDLEQELVKVESIIKEKHGLVVKQQQDCDVLEKEQSTLQQ